MYLNWYCSAGLTTCTAGLARTSNFLKKANMFKPVDKAAGQHACYSLMFTGFLHCEFFPPGGRLWSRSSSSTSKHISGRKVGTDVFGHTNTFFFLHSSYSPNPLFPHKSLLFSKVKLKLKIKHFHTVEEIQLASEMQISKYSKQEVQDEKVNNTILK